MFNLWYSPGKAYRTQLFDSFFKDVVGYTQRNNTKDSLQAQIDYEQYLKRGNERALADWQKNVGSKGRTIRYPEFTYPGQIYRSDTSIARAIYDQSTSDANFFGNIPYRASGLYSIASRFSRFL